MADVLHVLDMLYICVDTPARIAESRDTFTEEQRLFMAQKISLLSEKVKKEASFNQTFLDISNTIKRIMHPEAIVTLSGMYPTVAIPLGFKTMPEKVERKEMGGVVSEVTSMDFPYFVVEDEQFALAPVLDVPNPRARDLIANCRFAPTTQDITILYNKFFEQVSGQSVFEVLSEIVLVGEQISSEKMEEYVFVEDSDEVDTTSFFEKLKMIIDEKLDDMESQIVPTTFFSSSTVTGDFKQRLEDFVRQDDVAPSVVEQRSLSLDPFFSRSRMRRPNWQNKEDGNELLRQLVSVAKSLASLRKMKSVITSQESILKFLDIMFSSFNITYISASNVCLDASVLNTIAERAVTQKFNEYDMTFEGRDGELFDHEVAECMREANDLNFPVSKIDDGPFQDWQDLTKFEKPFTPQPEEQPPRQSTRTISTFDRTTLLPRVNFQWRYDKEELISAQVKKILVKLNGLQQRFFLENTGAMLEQYVPGDIQKRLKMTLLRSGRKFYFDYMDESPNWNPPNVKRLRETDFEQLSPILSDIFHFVMANDLIVDCVQSRENAVHKARAKDFTATVMTAINRSQNVEQIKTEIKEMYNYVNANFQLFLSNDVEAAKELINIQNSIGAVVRTRADLTGLIPNNMDDTEPVLFADITIRRIVQEKFKNYLNGERTFKEFNRLFLQSLVYFKKDISIERGSRTAQTSKNYVNDEFNKFFAENSTNFYLGDEITGLFPNLSPGRSGNRYTQRCTDLDIELADIKTFDGRRQYLIEWLRTNANTRGPLFLGRLNSSNPEKQKKFYMRNRSFWRVVGQLIQSFQQYRCSLL